MPTFTPAPSVNLPFTVDGDGNVIFNDDGANVDFTIESDGDADSFFFDGSSSGMTVMRTAQITDTLQLKSGYGEIFSIGLTNAGDRPLIIKAYNAAANNKSIDFQLRPGGSNTSVLFLDGANGRVGIKNTSPTKELDVTGDIIASGDMTCNALTQTSMRSLKKNIATITKTKAKVIPFKEYNFKSGNTTRKRYGVVAEDIETDYPELVYDLGNGVKAVNYIDLLVKRVAEMEKELSELTGTKGDKGDTGSTGAKGDKGDTGTNGSNGKDGNSHLNNITSIGIDKKSGNLIIEIGKNTYGFAPLDD
tara:strand:- start:3041 stop:3955 length:915 start_codon:yes stop_codon:yes gene_type:complete